MTKNSFNKEYNINLGWDDLKFWGYAIYCLFFISSFFTFEEFLIPSDGILLLFLFSFMDWLNVLAKKGNEEEDTKEYVYDTTLVESILGGLILFICAVFVVFQKGQTDKAFSIIAVACAVLCFFVKLRKYAILNELYAQRGKKKHRGERKYGG